MSQNNRQKVKHLEQLKFPIGKFVFNSEKADIHSILRIKSLPNNLKMLLRKVEKNQLKWRYRPDGWQLCQLIHHIADSHINAYIRMRVAYTNSGESIAPYDEKAWADLPDSSLVEVSNSMQIIFSIHQRWVTFLEHLEESDLEKTYFHPADKVHVSLREAIQMYAWHSDHHYAHLEQGLKSGGKY